LEAWSVLFVFVLVWLEVGWEVTEAVTDLFSVVVVVVVTMVVVVWATAVLVA
jgi:hypothetical protein